MKKYCVHMGVRLTKDYYVLANDEDEAQKLADDLFGVEDYSTMDYADSDMESWEDKTILNDDVDVIGAINNPIIEEIVTEMDMYADETAQFIDDINNGNKSKWYPELKKKPALLQKLQSMEEGVE